jgi:hypothetical protein
MQGAPAMAGLSGGVALDFRQLQDDNRHAELL